MRQSSVALVLAVASCSPVGDTPHPTTVDSLMVEAFVDLHLASARALVASDSVTIAPDSILSIHGLSRADFDARMAYYAENPEAYVALYNRVLDVLGEEVHRFAGY